MSVYDPEATVMVDVEIVAHIAAELEAAQAWDSLRILHRMSATELHILIGQYLAEPRFAVAA